MSAEPPFIEVDELRRLAESERVLLHVLPAISYAKQHLPGAKLASFYDDDFLERVAALAPETEEPLVVYCLSASCNAAERAAGALAQAGYAQVRVLRGGLFAWREAGLPLASGG